MVLPPATHKLSHNTAAEEAPSSSVYPVCNQFPLCNPSSPPPTQSPPLGPKTPKSVSDKKRFFENAMEDQQKPTPKSGKAAPTVCCSSAILISFSRLFFFRKSLLFPIARRGRKAETGGGAQDRVARQGPGAPAVRRRGGRGRRQPVGRWRPAARRQVRHQRQ